jgi:hypothetical protein
VDRVNTLGGNLLGQDGVLGVGGQVLSVGRVRRGQLNGRDQVLVEKALTDVAGRNVVAQGSVAVDGGVGVNQQVDVSGAGGVVAREDGLELDNTVGVSLLDTAEESLVDVGLIGGVAVAGSDDTGVNTGRVAVPHLEVDVRDRLAGIDVDDLVVDDGVDTSLVLSDVAADVLATNI